MIFRRDLYGTAVVLQLAASHIKLVKSSVLPCPDIFDVIQALFVRNVVCDYKLKVRSEYFQLHE
mgnify:FL=1